MMLALPEVKALTDKIPAAALLIEPDPIHLRFFQYARDSRMPLRDQCQYLGLPWIARKIPPGFETIAAISVARSLAPSVFSAAMPPNEEEFHDWVSEIIQIDELIINESARRWYAFHCLELKKKSEGNSIRAFQLYAEMRDTFPKVSVDHILEHYETNLRRLRTQRECELVFSGIGTIGQHFYSARNSFRFPTLPSRDYDLFDVQSPRQHNYENGRTGPHILLNFEITLLDSQEQFRTIGDEMENCISDKTEDTPRGVKVDYFDRFATGRSHFAVFRIHKNAMAVVEYTQDWRPIQYEGPQGSSISDERLLDVILRLFPDLMQNWPASKDERDTTKKRDPMEVRISLHDFETLPETIEIDSRGWTGDWND
ncbi:hypothetical protein [Roseibium sp. Sym1]|uniref:hypothetical protein n=1 Tax=Roseibium sp. Sym1 TaxID=3016006 RepID=UPI0022B301FB|nr:hypothetical protein [Roseibium sp. Sym1]